MGLMINYTSILILLLACVNLVSAEYYYIGQTVGGIVGLVSKNKDICFFFQKISSLFVFLF